jgi:CRISPR-associated protein Cmr4
MTNYLTYSYLLTPLHTGGSSQEGNLVGIAREAHTELPYLPSSSLRGKIRAVLNAEEPKEASLLFGEKIKDGQQPTEGEVWFADASLLMFPVASYSHQFIWITCPLWLSRWNRWLGNTELQTLITQWRKRLSEPSERGGKKAITSIAENSIYLQGALITEMDIEHIQADALCWKHFSNLPNGNGILDLERKLLILSDNDCASLTEVGLQREVRVALNENEKTVAKGSFRSEEAIPSETVMFFPWGLKPEKTEKTTEKVRESLKNLLNNNLQFGGLEGLGRGWVTNSTIKLSPNQGE